MTDTIGILHALDGAGAPLVHRCLGAMQGVTLLSRIHPMAAHLNNPLEQADRWFGLITDDDRNRLRSQADWPYQDIMQMIADRAEAAGTTLVVGDWSNVDFIGGVSVDQLAGIFVHRGVLDLKFHVKACALVRHPVDQWLAVRDRGPGDPNALNAFMRGYLRFAQCIADMPVVKYEHFVDKPGTILAEICAALGAPYDEGWESAWAGFMDIAVETPDDKTATTLPAASSGDYDSELLSSFEILPDYRPALEALGYAHPG